MDNNFHIAGLAKLILSICALDKESGFINVVQEKIKPPQLLRSLDQILHSEDYVFAKNGKVKSKSFLTLVK